HESRIVIGELLKDKQLNFVACGLQSARFCDLDHVSDGRRVLQRSGCRSDRVAKKLRCIHDTVEEAGGITTGDRRPARRGDAGAEHIHRPLCHHAHRAAGRADNMVRGRLLHAAIGEMIGGAAGRQSETQLGVVGALGILEARHIGAEMVEQSEYLGGTSARHRIVERYRHAFRPPVDGCGL
ncbi:hypothetical protein FKL64_23940, partial [Escherichia coli]|nr:hypothetical protein [Escherichia coli]